MSVVPVGVTPLFPDWILAALWSTPARSRPVPHAGLATEDLIEDLDVAFVLDTSGSMQYGTPASRLRTATESLSSVFGGDTPDIAVRHYELADNALAGSLFRMLRQGQRVVFDLDDDGRATALRLGSEVDMGTPGHA